jgi:phosphoglycerate dehydrogenase-like enzyme
MAHRFIRFCRDYHDVVDAEYLRQFPEIEALRPADIDSFAAALDGAEILMIHNSGYTPEVAQAVAEHGSALKWIQFTTVGIEIAEAEGLPGAATITNVGDVHQKILAGHAMALMLGIRRQFHAYEKYRATRDWARDEFAKGLAAPGGGVMVICGMGRIGQDVARKAKAFDMEVVCVTRADAPASAHIDRVVPRGSLKQVLPEADVVMITMPLDDETRDFIDAGEFSVMKDSAVIVNISRGGIVNEAALAEALAAGQIAGAGFDAFEPEPISADSPFWDLDNMLITPHVGAQGGGQQFELLHALVCENTRRYLDGKPLLNVVKEPTAG